MNIDTLASGGPAPAPAPAARLRSGDRTTWVWLTLLLAGALALRVGLAALDGAGLHVDEAQYWLWSQHLQWGYYSKPPGIAALIAASTTLFGTSVLGVKLLAIACYPVTAGILYAVAAEIARSAGQADDAAARVGGWTAALFLASPLAGLLGLTATTDAPLLLCWAAALWALWHAVGGDRPGPWRLWVLLGVALGLGLLSKYAMAALLPGLWWLALRRHGWAGLCRAAMATGLAALALLPHGLWNAAAGWPTLHHTVASTGAASVGHGSGAAVRMAEFWGAQALIFGPLALWLLWRRHGRGCLTPAARQLLLASTVPLLAAALLQGLRGRLEVNWIAPAHLGVVLAASLWAAPQTRRLTRRWTRMLCLQVGWVVLLAMAPAMLAALRPGHFMPAALDPWARMRGWDDALAQLRPHLPPGAQRPLLLSPSRQALAHAGWAWRDLSPRLAAFNPDGRVDHHFALQCPLASALALPGPWLLLTEGAAPSELLQAFADVKPLGTARVPRSPGRFVEMRLALAQGALRPANPHPPFGDCP